MRSFRNKRKRKNKIESKVKEWKYLKESQKDFDELFSLYEEELNEVIADLSQYNFSKDCEVDSAPPPIDFDGTYDDQGIYEIPKSDSKPKPEWAKQLYKKIAKQTHPDKIERFSLTKEEKQSREKIFKDSARFLEQGNYEDLVFQALDLGIEIDIKDEEYLEMLDSSIRKINFDRTSKQKQVCWLWGESSSDIAHRSDLILKIFQEIGEPQPPIEVVKEYFKSCEKDTIEEWKIKFLQ